MVGNNGGRRRYSQRLREMNSFSKFTNDKERPVELDDDGNDLEFIKQQMKKGGRKRVVKDDTDVAVPHDPNDVKIKKLKITLNRTSSTSNANTEDATVKTKKTGKTIVNPPIADSDFVQEPTITLPKKSMVSTSKKASSSHIRKDTVPRNTTMSIVLKTATGPQEAKVGDGRVDDSMSKKSKKKGINKDSQKAPQDERAVDPNAEQYRVLRTRTSPRTLHETVHTLTESQRAAVTSMGLGSLLDIKVDGVPSRLGFYVVDNLDTVNMMLKVSHGSIPITIASIHELLGLPTGGIDILTNQHEKSEPNLNGMFRMQFDKKKMRPKDVMKLIQGSGDASDSFKLNFLVLFVNLMIDCNRMGCCNLSFLSSIKDLKQIHEIDWCKYLYDMLRTSKETWSRSSNVCFYAGPLTYLTLLYVESTIWPDQVVHHMRPATLRWSFEMLKKREAWEIANGGLGSAKLLDVTRAAEREVEIKIISDMISHVHDTRREIEQRLMACKAKYHADEAFEALAADLNAIFRSSTHKVSGQLSINDTANLPDVGPSSDLCVGKRGGHETPTDNELNQSPLSQYWLSQTLHKICDETVEKSISSKEPKALLDIRPPQFDLGISPIKPAEQSTVTKPPSKDKGKGVCIVDDAKVKKSNRFTGWHGEEDTTKNLKSKYVTASRRSVRLGDHLRSPYLRRAIDMKVTAEDRRILRSP